MLDLDSLLEQRNNEYKVCDRCKGVNLATLIPKIKAIDPKAIIREPSCVSYCGPGRDRTFVILNNKPIIADNEDELIEKIVAKIT